MGQKKITDLTVISSIADANNIPIDDGLQTYRGTALQLFQYIGSKLTSLTGVTPLAEDYVAGIDTSDSNANKKFAVSALRNAVYRNAVTTDTIGADDELVEFSGASFSATLPTAVGRAGKRYKLLHGGTSFTQIYTLLTTSAQTIGGIASGAYILYTAGEMLDLISDGANWKIVGHHTNTAPLAYTPTYTGFGTVSANDIKWFRQGSQLNFVGKFTSGTPTAVEARVSFPASCPAANLASIATVGTYGLSVTASTNVRDVLAENAQSYLTFSKHNAAVANLTKQNADQIVANTNLFSIFASVPIVGFQP